MKTRKNTIFSPLLFAVLLLQAALFSGAAQAQTNSDEPFSQAEIEQILAPIALYPDTILSHILVASTYPLEVVQAERWVAQRPDLEGQQAVEEAQGEDWDPSVQALVAFPQILKRMSDDLDWTQRLGEAFLQDQEQVLSSVQNLRELAQEAGTLEQMDRVTVSRDENVIIIEPREREIVYVPYYDTRSVYGHWRWPHYQPVYWDYPYSHGRFYDRRYPRRHGSAFFWGPRISLSFGFFFNTPHWRNHHIVRISPRHYSPRRYYGHHDILGHNHSERWEHRSHRPHNFRDERVSRRVENRLDARAGDLSGGKVEQRNERSQRREQLNQRRVQERLINSRRTPVRTTAPRRQAQPQNRVVVNQRPAVTQSNRSVQPRVNNRQATMPGRARAPERERVVNQANRRPAQQRQSQQRYSQPRVQQAPVSAPQARPAAAPARQTSASRPAARPKPELKTHSRKTTQAKPSARGGAKRQPR